ncbi:S1 RNA-binding domain-containing protein [Streptomyces sp. LHD-70]|uniref:S1 RNA-binding domain-containing protein n=1 Tax=Streptomyces sp. LHD-70 TaxID=3072140 RepID=UPI00280D80FD|nr:S1 RNA-binding domain-containing protein [Streptomyces sp. LHD-70]MDQ8705219.1 S1 RNA-binding domain-containing protein [Streptomyces sp. LHD-70]
MVHWRAESPQLWAYLESLQYGEILTGEVAAIERYGVFVALDDAPGHPTLPGVGFITVPELSWRHLGALSDVVAVGQRVTCAFLQFDQRNAEARLSLRALLPDPFRAFAFRTSVGQTLCGTVDKVVSFGVLVEVGDGVFGLLPYQDVDGGPGEVAPAQDLRPGDRMSVVVAAIDHSRRRVFLSMPSSRTSADEFRPRPRSTR